MKKTELELIAERIRDKKRQLETQEMPSGGDRELVSETIGEKIDESLLERPPGLDVIHAEEGEIATPFPADMAAQNRPAADAAVEEANVKLSELVSMALEQNIAQAVSTALKSGNAFLIDKLHDSLSDRYYQELKNKKLI